MTKSDRITSGEAVTRTGQLVTKTLLGASPDFFQMTEHLANAQGKGIRAALTAACALGEDGLVNTDAIRAAAAVELLHLATLVHDDVIDDAEVRRNAPTIQKKFGKREAVICGDYLLCLSLSTLSELYPVYWQKKYVNLHHVLISGLTKIAHGEFRELLNNHNLEMTLLDYLRVIQGKTAKLFQIAAFCGAVVGGCEEAERKQLSRFGQCLGMLFQIVDDCKDYELDEQSARKSVRNDLAEGVITLPLILALQKDPGLKPAAERALSGEEATIEALIARVRELGALNQAHRMIRKYYQKAEKLLDNLKPSNEDKRNELVGLLAKTVEPLSGFGKADDEDILTKDLQWEG